jgi:hypothetical protein
MNARNNLLGLSLIKDVTGEAPVYPGHALTIVYEIIHVFPNAQSALHIVSSEGLDCPEAVADGRITGGGSEVYLACEFLQRARKGEPVEKLIEWADATWVGGQAGGHVKNVEAGLAQADKLKAGFPEKFAAWLAQ